MPSVPYPALSKGEGSKKIYFFGKETKTIFPEEGSKRNLLFLQRKQKPSPLERAG